MKTKALFTFNFPRSKILGLEDLGFDIVLKDEKVLKYSRELEDVEFMFTYNPFSHFDISSLKKLKWIQLESDGIEQIPRDYIKKNGIIVTNNKDGYSIPISEWIIWGILSSYKKGNDFFINKLRKKWEFNNSLKEIFGETIGILGTGDIAMETARKLQPFGVNMLGLNTTGKPVKYFDRCYSNQNINLMVKKCDIIVCLLPITNKTHHFIDEKLFQEMKNGVIFINASRGQVVNEDNLIKFIQNGKIGAAVLDVVENEPLKQENPLWEMKNVIITPHNSWISQNMNKRKYKLVYENMRRYKNGEELKNIVNISKGY